MHKQIVGGLAILAVMAAGICSTPAEAAGIRPGKWEFTTAMAGIPMPQLPPGVKLPPNVHFGPRGSTYTTCITNDHPVPQQRGHNCTIEHMSRSGDTVSWAATCETPQGPMHSTGQATYSGDSMHSTMTIDGTGQGGPMHMTQTTTGRYLGPCVGG